MEKRVAKFKLACAVDVGDKASVMFIRALLKRGLGTMLRCKPQKLRAVFADGEGEPKAILPPQVEQVVIHEQHFTKPEEGVESNERTSGGGADGGTSANGSKMQRLQVSNARRGIILALPVVTPQGGSKHSQGNQAGE